MIVRAGYYFIFLEGYYTPTVERPALHGHGTSQQLHSAIEQTHPMQCQVSIDSIDSIVSIYQLRHRTQVPEDDL